MKNCSNHIKYYTKQFECFSVFIGLC